MFDLLTEVKKMKTMMGLIKEDQDLESINKHAQNILNILKFSGLYSSTISSPQMLSKCPLSVSTYNLDSRFQILISSCRN